MEIERQIGAAMTGGVLSVRPDVFRIYLIKNTASYSTLAHWGGSFAAVNCLIVGAMFEMVITIVLYVGALALLVKSAFAYCNHSHDEGIVTEPIATADIVRRR